MSFLTKIVNSFTEHINCVLEEAATRTENKFDVSSEELKVLWKDLFSGEFKTPKMSKETKKSKSPKSSKNSDDEENEGCKHIITRGPRKDLNCNNKISNKSSSNLYCNTHYVQYEKEKSKDKKSPKDKKKKVSKKSESDNEEEDKKEETVISKNKFGNYEHKLTNLVFVSGKEKVVYGKQDSDGEVKLLTKEDIQTCNKYLFKYDKTKINKDDNETKEDDNNEEDNDETKDEKEESDEEVDEEIED